MKKHTGLVFWCHSATKYRPYCTQLLAFSAVMHISQAAHTVSAPQYIPHTHTTQPMECNYMSINIGLEKHLLEQSVHNLSGNALSRWWWKRAWNIKKYCLLLIDVCSTWIYLQHRQQALWKVLIIDIDHNSAKGQSCYSPFLTGKSSIICESVLVCIFECNILNFSRNTFKIRWMHIWM